MITYDCSHVMIINSCKLPEHSYLDMLPTYMQSVKQNTFNENIYTGYKVMLNTYANIS